MQTLSPREREVLGECLTGRDLPSTACSLHISVHTLRNHIKAIYRKLEVHSRAELFRNYHHARCTPTYALLAED
ncbi:MAG: helix-turn-helix transcriptional regulator [Planctomycetota bacterium]